MIRRLGLTSLILISICGRGLAQDPLGWNGARALDLINRARFRRELPRGDSTLRNYQARANGFVYFYLDRPGSEERTLVRVDQIALDLFWKRPNLTKQHIVGLRDVNRLPNRMYYHLDHLTVVQNNLGDVIRIGDGDEVRDVPHPAAPGSDSIYDFRLADSVTIKLGGDQPEVRVYQVQVRPRRNDRSAMIGSVYVDRASADIVRMTFTFTPASYVDRRLDYINISLDNGLFGGSYWLPNEQSIEIRRQIPELDFAAGSVIKGHIRISQYQFNANIPDSVFYGRRVSAEPPEKLKAFEFPEDIYAGVNQEGLAPPPQMADLRASAAELAREHRLSGLAPGRLYAPNVSSWLRHNEAEGWYTGAGATYVHSPKLRVDFLGGYAFGAQRPELSATLRARPRDVQFDLHAYYNQPRDVGPIQGMPGVLNTLTSGFGGRDYTNMFFTRGVALRVSGGNGANRTDAILLRVERHRPGARDPHYSYLDPVSAIDVAEGALSVTRATPDASGWRWGAGLQVGYVIARDNNNPRGFTHFEIRYDSENKRRSVLGRIDGAFDPSDLTQHSLLLGGRETLPSFPYRSIDANAFALARMEVAQTIAYPWLRLRLTGAASQSRDVVHGGDITRLTTSNTRVSGGAGLGLLWDVVHVDFVNGHWRTSTGWKTIISIKRDFWPML
jgi:hypothetical protein